MWDDQTEGKRKRFGLLKCKGETQDSAFALISLHAFLSSWQYVRFSLCCVAAIWFEFVKTYFKIYVDNIMLPICFLSFWGQIFEGANSLLC